MDRCEKRLLLSEINELFKNKKTITKEIAKIAKKEVMNTWGFIFMANGLGTCTFCKNKIDTYGHRHLEHGKCPECGCEIQYVSNRYRSQRQDGYIDIAVPERIGRYFAFRLYHVWGRYSINKQDLNPIIVFDEHARVLYTEDGARWFSDEYKNMGYIKKSGYWSEYKNMTYGFRDNDVKMIYDFDMKLLESKLKRTTLQYMRLIVEYANDFRIYKKREGYKMFNLVAWVCRYPCIEYLYKLGFYDVIYDFVINGRRRDGMTLNLKGKTALEVLGVDVSYLRKYNIDKLNETDIKFLKFCKKINCKLSLDQYLDIKHECDNYPSIYNIYKLARLKPNKIVGYMRKQAKKNGALLYYKDYGDYIEECIKLNYDISDEQIIYPSNLREAHSRTAALVEYENNKNKEEEFLKKVKKYVKFQFEEANFSIIPAMSMQLVIAEGKYLHHCVGGYVKQVAEGRSMIFFVRKSDDINTPYYTLELNPKTFNIVQCRGDRNCGMTDEVQSFVEKWKQEVIDKRQKQKIAS